MGSSATSIWTPPHSWASGSPLRLWTLDQGVTVGYSRQGSDMDKGLRGAVPRRIGTVQSNRHPGISLGNFWMTSGRSGFFEFDIEYHWGPSRGLPPFRLQAGCLDFPPLVLARSGRLTELRLLVGSSRFVGNSIKSGRRCLCP